MKPRKVLIVGGGVAGWMTAAHLQSTLKRSGHQAVDIGVVAPASATDSGVGETTIPDINRFFAILGVDQLAFMREVSGTLRQGTKFVNWLYGEGEHYYHPFSMERQGSIDRAAERWLRSNRTVPFAETISVQPSLCERNLAPLMLSRWDFGPPLPYAFHVDEGKFAFFLQKQAMQGGVRHHADEVNDVELAEDGQVAAVLTRAGQRIEADLFVDCSGPDAPLFEKLGVGWVDRSRHVLCDRRLTMSVPYDVHYSGHVRPFTTATALAAGWVQDVPLQDRRSLAYYHASEFEGDEAATQALKAFEGPHSAPLDVAVERVATGHREQAWVGNCIAIGASGSAIEPLEGTNLYLIDHATSMLAEHFPLGDETQPLAFRFSRIMANRFYEMLDFVNLHYCLTQRQDSEFWREAGRPERMTSRIAAKLAYWRMKRPTPSDFEDQKFPGQPDEPLPKSDVRGDYRSPVDTAALWTHENYEAVLYGMDFLGKECDAWFGAQREDPQVPPMVAARVAQAPQKLPPHALWLQQMAGMAEYSAS